MKRGLILVAGTVLALSNADGVLAKGASHDTDPRPVASTDAAQDGSTTASATTAPSAQATEDAAPEKPEATKLESPRKHALRSGRYKLEARAVPEEQGPDSATTASTTGTTVVPQSNATAAVPVTAAPQAQPTGLAALFASVTTPLAAKSDTSTAQVSAQPAADAPAADEEPGSKKRHNRYTEADEARAASMHDLIAKHAAANGIPFDLADAVIRIESRYQARIVHAGNYGLMQLRAGTARSMGFSGTASALLDPETNLQFGMKYLGVAYKLAGGDTCRTIMRYQSGLMATRVTAANRLYCARARSMMAGL